MRMVAATRAVEGDARLLSSSLDLGSAFGLRLSSIDSMDSETRVARRRKSTIGLVDMLEVVRKGTMGGQTVRKATSVRG